ncbi:ATP-dependent RNA helicase HrpA [Cellulomonas sp. P22]|uniref:ATP-dependent RNA helicase HrpA n=1 Tax=Cellulomonas sp. P22 TaxID=3373189 RepID=UPI0037B821FC
MSTAGDHQPRPEGTDPGSRPARRRRPPRRRPRTDPPATSATSATTPPARDSSRPDQSDGGHRRERRAQARRDVVVPPITYPEQLPVSARREDIAAAIRDHQVVIVAGETGSGKTTQLPKIALDLGRGREGQIGHTQPRRIAARTVAERIAEELGTSIGELVGYQVRFTDESSERTLVKVMTDGILLAQIQRDPMLRGYDTLIIDEAHERSLNIDFLLGYLTRLLPQRPDLKVVITSATIDSERFARHFSGPPTPEHPDGVPAPVIEVTGRTYPVEVRYRPLTPDPEPEPEPGEQGALKAAPRGGKKQREVEDRDPLTAICEAFDELAAEGPGDILVFFSGEREIRDAEEALRSHLGERANDLRRPDAVEILPLYGRLSAAEQHRVFQQHGNRRVVLATNVAETSLTVPGIRYVIDPGTARISRYSKATKVQRLPIEPISQASANQRSGRCGRVADGIAIRLYSHQDFESRPEFTEPEILRTSLASVILQMIAVGVATTPDDIAKFPFVDPPDTRAVRDGTQLLTELGALGAGDDAGAGLTKVGRDLAQLPMDPRLGRMIVEAGRRGVAREVMIIAAALSIQDPRERPMEQRAQADQQHARFADPTSDFLTYLNLWQYLKEQQRELSGSAFRRMCKAEHLNHLRIREWQDVVTQLRELAKPLGIVVNPPPQRTPPPAAATSGTTPSGTTAPAGPRRRTAPGAAQTVLASDTAEGPGTLRLDWDADRIHMSLLAGLLSQIGMQEATEVTPPAAGRGKKPVTGRPDRRGRNEYVGARGARFAIFPGSALAKRPPAWIMAGELVETSRLWARDAARIQPEWAEELAQHLVKRTYSEPSWSTKQGAAMALERVLLYGVPIVAQRRVLYAKHDPEHARELFIRHALVEGEWTTHHEFFHENRRLLAEAESLEARARRRDLVVDDEVLFAFYDERIPADVVSARHFDQWWKTARRTDPDLLSFTRELLVADEGATVSDADFPSTWPQGDLELPLTYQFEPGADADGVTVHVPLVLLARVRPDGFGWMVPGLREELVTATIRALPKPVRVQLVPAPDVARGVVAWFDEHLASWEDTVRAGELAPSFHEAFAQAVRALRDVEVPPDAFDDEKLPPHLRVTFRVEDDGRVVEEGKDLIGLQRRLAHRTQDAVSTAVRTAVRDAMREVAGGRGDRRGRGGGTLPVAEPSADPATAPAPDRAVPATERLSPGIAERTGLTQWPADLPDDGTVPLTVETSGRGGLRVRGYPALVEEDGGTVALRVLADPATQVVEHRRGLLRLLLRDVGLATPRVTTRWSGQQALTLAASPYPSTDALVADVQLAAIDHLLTEHLQGRPATEVRTAAAYAQLRAAVRDRLEDTVHRTVTDLVAVLGAARELDAEVRASTSLALLATLQDVREQAARLVHVGFVSEVGITRLPHLARYLRAARHRLTKAAANPDRDASLAWTVAELTREYTTARARAEATASRTQAVDPDRRAAFDAVRWMIEELRVSLFAQQLGTDGPVSEKRIRKALAEA